MAVLFSDALLSAASKIRFATGPTLSAPISPSITSVSARSFTKASVIPQLSIVATLVDYTTILLELCLNCKSLKTGNINSFP